MGEQGRVREVVIVGAGLAGLSAAETLRRAGYDGRLTLLGAERELPYDRPPLSKDLLAGAISEAKVFLRPPEFYDEQRITLRLGAQAVGLDAADRAVRLADGGVVPFDAALLATGSAPRHLAVPGADLPGVHYLRTLADERTLSVALAEAQRDAMPVVLIGAGFIGAEVAAVCRARGLAVTIVEPLTAPMVRALGQEVGTLFAELHRARGVELRLRTGVVAFHGAGRVEAVEIEGGERLPSGLAIVAIGARPLVEWLADSGVALRNGVIVSERCETNVPGVYAAGDIAEWPYTPASGAAFPVRLEHWDNALRQGEAAARAMLGGADSYHAVPYFWSDQYDWRAQMAGLPINWERVVVRGQPGEASFSVCYLGADGRPRAALSVNRVREFLALKKLVAAGTPVSSDELADDALDVRTLANRSAPPPASV